MSNKASGHIQGTRYELWFCNASYSQVRLIHERTRQFKHDSETAKTTDFCTSFLSAEIQVKREFSYRDCYAQAEYHHHHHHHHPGAGGPRPGEPGAPGPGGHHAPGGPGPGGPLPTYQRRGSLQLWQFLVALLDDPANTPYIAWTGRGLEFKLIEPEEVRQGHVGESRGFVAWFYHVVVYEAGNLCQRFLGVSQRWFHFS